MPRPTRVDDVRRAHAEARRPFAIEEFERVLHQPEPRDRRGERDPPRDLGPGRRTRKGEEVLGAAPRRAVQHVGARGVPAAVDEEAALGLGRRVRAVLQRGREPQPRARVGNDHRARRLRRQLHAGPRGLAAFEAGREARRAAGHRRREPCRLRRTDERVAPVSVTRKATGRGARAKRGRRGDADRAQPLDQRPRVRRRRERRDRLHGGGVSAAPGLRRGDGSDFRFGRQPGATGRERSGQSRRERQSCGPRWSASSLESERKPLFSAYPSPGSVVNQPSDVL